MSEIAANEQAHRIATDVVVVGAGIVGLAVAWRLAARRGLGVVVVDRGVPGREASWVGAGMLAPATEAQFGEEELLALTLAGNTCWDGFAAELEAATGLPAGLRRCGTLHLALRVGSEVRFDQSLPVSDLVRETVLPLNLPLQAGGREPIEVEATLSTDAAPILLSWFGVEE